MENFFKESTLVSLRELALRQTAHELDIRETIETPEEKKEIRASPASQKEIRDRILIYVTADPSSAMLIRRGRRMADYLGADSFAVGVLPRRGDHRPADERIDAVEAHLNFARNLHVEARILEGNDPAETIVDFARRNQITQILLGRPLYHSWSRLLGTDLVLRIVRKTKDIRVIILAERRRQYQQSAV
jgi:two-component system sensor histidine kinase KdpD